MNSNSRKLAPGVDSIEPVAQTVRADIGMGAAVDRGLAAALLIGQDAGAAVMRIGGVPDHVSTRVLHSGAPHRATDWKQ